MERKEKSKKLHKPISLKKINVLALRDMYESEYILLAGTTTQMQEYFYEKRLEQPPTLEKLNWVEGLMYNNKNTTIIMIMKDDLGIIVHECIHAIQHAMDDIGVDTGIDNTEITAYGTEWLFRIAAPFYGDYFAKLKEQWIKQ